MKKIDLREIFILITHSGFGIIFLIFTFVNAIAMDGRYLVFWIVFIALPILMLIHHQRKYVYLQMLNIIDGVILLTTFIALIAGVLNWIALLILSAIFIPSFVFGYHIQKEMTKQMKDSQRK